MIQQWKEKRKENMMDWTRLDRTRQAKDLFSPQISLLFLFQLYKKGLKWLILWSG